MTGGILQRLRNLPLSGRILAPFFILLVLLGVIATLGVVYQTRKTLSDTIDSNLLAMQSTIEQAIRDREARLRSESALVSAMLEQGIDLSSLHDRKILQDMNRHRFRVLTPTDIVHTENRELRQLFKHAGKSGRERIRFLNDDRTGPALVLVRPFQTNDGHSRFLLGTEPLGKPFLSRLMRNLQGRCFLFDYNGRYLSGTTGTVPPIRLDNQQIAEISAGKKLVVPTGWERYQLFAVPLGTTDMVILAVGISTIGLTTLAGNLALGSSLTLAAALLFSGLFFSRHIRRLLAPVRELAKATETISAGNFQIEIPVRSEDELGILTRSFNTMVRQLDILYQEKIAKERELATLDQEKHYKEILEAKNAEIERVNRELRKRLKEMSALMELNRAMTSSLDLDILFERMLATIIDQFLCDRVVLFTYNPGNEELLVRKAHGIDQDLLRGVSFSLGEGITGKAALAQKIIYVADLQKDERTLGYKGRHHSRGSMVAIPLVVKQRLVGVLNLHKIETDAFSGEELKLLQAIANQAAISIDNSQLFEKARDLSNTDELTGLANRRHFQMILKREAAQARRFHSHFSLIMADIDHFKAFNDTHGHLKGDIVLKKVADILLQNTRGIDLVGRFGGEEFVILLPKTDKAGAEAAAEKLRSHILAENFPGEEKSQPGGCLTLSLGIAEYPGDSTDIYELLDMADRALYRAKENGRNCVVSWREEIHAVS
ncbi:diguanylate cyclase (GGDEF)-like protein [Geothermobacter ehrlichii]|uniref:diguanylate cyclase n=1 Tax=Geothermobacter ehrlichii TaxID=213224 RepID=A0A5D3WKM6_9BACT|nr:diguanylate cyclase [Geothermobacter ehrlichii]TYO99554.1 diguanylate cyclase (GGDEF)-like protein [Geothermobacter ehrlichii]